MGRVTETLGRDGSVGIDESSSPAPAPPLSGSRQSPSAAVSEQAPPRLGTNPRDIASLYINHRHEFAVLAHRYLRNPFDVDEVVQEAFLRLVLSMPELETELQAVAYARRTVTNLCLDRLRRDKRAPAPTPLDEMPLEMPSDDAPLDDPILAAEDSALVRAALAKLAPTQRRALVAFEVEERPVPDIAAELGIEETAVKHVLYRARRQLRKLLVGSQVDPATDLLTMTGSDVWTIAAKRAAHGAQRVGVWMLLIALPALAALGLWRSASSGVDESQIAEPPVTGFGGGLFDPHSTIVPTPPVPAATKPTKTSTPPSQPSEVASSAQETQGSNARPESPPASGSAPSARPTRSPSVAPSPHPRPSGTPSGTSAPASHSPTPDSAGGVTVPKGFVVGGAIDSTNAGAVVVERVPATNSSETAHSELAFIATTAAGSLRIDVSVDSTPGSLQLRATPTLPVNGAASQFDPVSEAVTKATADDRGSVLVDMRLALSGAGRVLGPADGPGLAAKPSSLRLVLVLTPGLDRISSGRLEILGIQAVSTPTAAPSPIPTLETSVSVSPPLPAGVDTAAPMNATAGAASPLDAGPSPGVAGTGAPLPVAGSPITPMTVAPTN